MPDVYDRDDLAIAYRTGRTEARWGRPRRHPADATDPAGRAYNRGYDLGLTMPPVPAEAQQRAIANVAHARAASRIAAAAGGLAVTLLIASTMHVLATLGVGT